ncbi:uncharacterized protein PFL1_00622 [Pseudozyma flocculosa PF-1]|uniref:Related to ribonuclease T1 n=1 Tax=Pseudozyma flocculosa TaxID=84751 RepID=A0A5C3ERV9_9BASI|nr:uncharacterized protein PFL1_00622 [Pseudozyma flocculosa PF-1]EPQ32426.1 hypothetical protein PFL1_00622 [Pseudozyma flocculosa PF-1]SPO34590.1 related to ribonuclease T1 [Pseudozyma flocculosa]
MQYGLALFALFPALAVAAPAGPPLYVFPNPTRSPPPSTLKCGTNEYADTDVQDAISLAQIAQFNPIRGYPKKFKNYEGFNFSAYCSGPPYYEYPLVLTAGGYTGGNPGPDRVIYDSGGEFCGAVTHTRAPTPNGFIRCIY